MKKQEKKKRNTDGGNEGLKGRHLQKVQYKLMLASFQDILRQISIFKRTYKCRILHSQVKRTHLNSNFL